MESEAFVCVGGGGGEGGGAVGVVGEGGGGEVEGEVGHAEEGANFLRKGGGWFGMTNYQRALAGICV